MNWTATRVTLVLDLLAYCLELIMSHELDFHITIIISVFVHFVYWWGAYVGRLGYDVSREVSGEETRVEREAE